MIFIYIIVVLSHIALFYLGCLHGLKLAQVRLDKLTMAVGTKLDQLGVKHPYSQAAELIASLQDELE